MVRTCRGLQPGRGLADRPLHVARLMQDAAQVDEIIERLLDARNGRPGKQVQLAENEIRLLCLTAKEIFMSQPNLLELEAPIKICGGFIVLQWDASATAMPAVGCAYFDRLTEHANSLVQVTYTGSIQTCYGSSSTAGSHQKPTTCS